MTAPAFELDALISREYQHGFFTDVETDTVPRGLSEDVIRLISAKKNEPEFMLEWRLKAYRHWLTMTEPHWANGHASAHRLPGHRLLLRAEAQMSGPKSLDEVDPELLRTYEKLGIPLERAEAARRRGGGRGVRQRFGGDHLQGEAGRARHHLLLVLRSGAGASGTGPTIPRLGGALHRQLLRDAQLGGVHRRLVLLHPARACAARWSCRPTSASTPRTPASSSAR